MAKKKKSFKQEILESQEILNEIYQRAMEKGTYEDWLKRFGGKR